MVLVQVITPLILGFVWICVFGCFLAAVPPQFCTSGGILALDSGIDGGCVGGLGGGGCVSVGVIFYFIF